MYYLPEPPYVLLIFGLFIGITSGLAFEATLKLKVQQWMKQSQALSQQETLGFDLLFPFWGICIGICVFLEAGLEIFLLNPWIAYSIALPLTIFIGGLVWMQLGKLLQQLLTGGSKAIDLDAF
ncbi:conserved hypothetical protein [Gloeothece citriformis PCC 7424]|uniref:Uncharacterized protein n=1 Tax=Gloeothece citriformis (strain PCC 7424) TaxID=65393 RepID=B7KJB3_GLOC7|nr:hypothetical protein [Gloeothece citriformis]ACK72197.1 conserved hypothetical protein [Gloeothece citriformis PCC 7424]